MTLFVVSVLAVLLWAAPATAAGEGVRCQVTTPVLRVRAAPDEAQIGSAFGGTWLTVTGRDGDGVWAQVEWSGREGWVMTTWLRCEGSLDAVAEVQATPDSAPTAEASAAPESAAEAETKTAPARSETKRVTPPEPAMDPVARAMLDVVNETRARAGLPAYSLDPRAQDAAQWQAEDMVYRRYFAHNTPDGQTPSMLMRARGIACAGWCGQNIVMGQGRDEVAYALNWFMNSTVHRANLLSRQYTGIGVGVAVYRNGYHYFVLNFFRE
jgi:uncharacterized protein YkwD